LGDTRLRWIALKGLYPTRETIDSDIVVDRLVLAFVELRSTLASPRLRRCAGDNCGWFFIDTSKGGRRRWCDMATCGNTAKYVRARG
jgi:predicted RNA-binding Zn ribbon-like protein